jgi:hypothetical protein
LGQRKNKQKNKVELLLRKVEEQRRPRMAEEERSALRHRYQAYRRMQGQGSPSAFQRPYPRYYSYTPDEDLYSDSDDDYDGDYGATDFEEIIDRNGTPG